MKLSLPKTVAVLALTFLTAGFAGNAQAAPQQDTSEKLTLANSHCVVRVTDQQPDGEYVLSDPACYETLTELNTALGFQNPDNEKSVGKQIRNQTKVNSDMLSFSQPAMTMGAEEEPEEWVIGRHYDYLDWIGPPTFTIMGSDCAGGYISLYGHLWDRRISSTINGCELITHFDGYNMLPDIYGGETTFAPGGNLTTLNNRTSSVQYFSWDLN
ncbi:MAG: hypothetical protein WC184_11715 [Acidimicrobiia bacterium]